MINVLVPITEKVEAFVSFVKENAKRNTKFYVGVTQNLAEKLPKMAGVEVHVFKADTNKEQMLNSLHKCSIKKGKIVVVRRPLTTEEFSALTDSKADIAKFKPQQNKFVTFFKNLAKKLLRKIFALNYFEDISGVAFGENLFELISVCPNLSMATRIDRYVGVDVEEIPTAQKPVKRTYNKWLNSLWFIVGILFFLGSVTGGLLIFVNVPNIWAVYILLIMTWWIIAFIVMAATTLKFTRAICVGDLDYNSGEEIENKRGVKNEKN